MPDHQAETPEDKPISGRETRSNEQVGQQDTPAILSAMKAGQLLDQADNIIYTLAGICFFGGALFTIGYSLWTFILAILQIPSLSVSQQPKFIIAAIVHFLADLLLVLIIAEVLGTIIHYLKAHVTSLRPYLGIGIISSVRVILALGAELLAVTESSQQDFYNIMIELGVTAGVILALSITLRLLERHDDINS